MISKDREYRFFDIHTRAAESNENEKENDYKIEGYALNFNTRTCLYEQDGVKYYEQIDRKALDSAKMDDVVLNFNHAGKPVARTRNKTLDLTIDENGLKISAYLGGTAEGRNMYDEIKGGYLDRMSFAFIYTSQAGDYDKKTRTNTITHIDRLFDVSVVDFPAYDSTTVNARSQDLFKAEALKEKAEARAEAINAVKRKILKQKIERAK